MVNKYLLDFLIPARSQCTTLCRPHAQTMRIVDTTAVLWWECSDLSQHIDCELSGKIITNLNSIENRTSSLYFVHFEKVKWHQNSVDNPPFIYLRRSTLPSSILAVFLKKKMTYRARGRSIIEVILVRTTTTTMYQCFEALDCGFATYFMQLHFYSDSNLIFGHAIFLSVTL